MDYPGLGTLTNVGAIVVGSLLGMAVGQRLPDRVRDVVTDCLGLVTLLVAAQSAMSVADPALAAAVGSGAVLIVLGALLIGSIVGSGLRIADRLEQLAGRVHTWTTRPGTVRLEASGARQRFIDGWLTATLLFCVGPLAVLGSISDGLGLGIDQLVLKAVLDGFAALAFASTFGVGVLLSAVSVGVYQGALTVVGMLLGSVVPEAHVAALTATGGLMLVGIGLRLLRIRDVPVADMLPALVVAPLLTQVVVLFR
ncbi:DUF554 domain-containing protein [Georgenia thermotolerans]|uniref:DUF554 family protein n=1 Tax=Georgenia thermotolerans TaxID=527326 RepID=A0A7J5UV30_9MICO|nr:DUF554 domain-containing protein [Georgenia thermotolerans]KAE8766145.1 DUF554 family protein [Georgenia thermotolerans]